MKIIAILSEWCPACIEYKIVLNYIVSNNNIEVIMAYPKDIQIPIRSIPTTIFLNDEELLYVQEGYVPINRFMKIYNTLLKQAESLNE